MTEEGASLADLHAALRASWSQWTCDPSDQSRWTPDNRSWGQCGASALVIQDHLGGELLLATVRGSDGSDQDWHYWNRLPDGTQPDLTRDQFRDGQIIGEPEVQARRADLSRARFVGHYALLSHRVARALAPSSPPDGAGERPVSIKAVCTDGNGQVVLCRNGRGDWELPGGRPEVGEAFEETVIRELYEETGLRGEVDRLIGVRDLEVSPGRWVDIVAYRCTVPEPVVLTVSAEHAEVALRHAEMLPDAELPLAYRELALSAGRSCA